MELSEIEQLVDLMKRSNVRELTLKSGESRITLKKPLPDVAGGMEIAVYEYGEVAVGSPNNDDAGFEGEYDFNSEITDSEMLQHVTAPLVGIFHNVKPLIGAGAKVKAGQPIGIIEAMKLITEVTSPVDGVVTETLIEEGMPAEYGQPLFVVKPDSLN